MSYKCQYSGNPATIIQQQSMPQRITQHATTYVVLPVLWDVKVDNEVDAGNVKTTTCYVGGDEDVA